MQHSPDLPAADSLADGLAFRLGKLERVEHSAESVGLAATTHAVGLGMTGCTTAHSTLIVAKPAMHAVKSSAADARTADPRGMMHGA